MRWRWIARTQINGRERASIFDQDRKFVAEWKQFGRPSGVFVDKDDRLYVVDADSSTANNPAGRKAFSWERRTGAPRSFQPSNRPGRNRRRSIVIDGAGNMPRRTP